MNLPLGPKIALWTALPLVVVTALSGFLEYQRSRAELREAAATIGEGFLAEFGRRIGFDVAVEDTGRLDDAFSDLHAILPEMHRGEILVDGDTLLVWEPHPFARVAPVGQLLTLAHDLRVEGASRGRVVISIDERRFAPALARRHDQILEQTIIGGALLVLICFAIGQALSRRIRRLAEQSQRIAQGDFTAEVIEGSDEIGRVGHAFNQMARELEEQQASLAESRDEALASAHAAREATAAKSRFLANMSHEIRTPLTAVLGFGENLLDPTLTDHERDEASRAILRNGHHLMMLINDILDLSKAEAGRIALELRAISVVRIVDEVAEAVAGRARSKGLAFEVILPERLPRTIQTDPTRLRQILLNLVGNAVKFTESGTVTLEVRDVVPTEGNDGRIAFAVRDSGIGIPEHARGQLFRPFTQADSTMSRRFGGTGLGLSICAELAKLLGGTIDLESEEGVGSTFTATIATGSLEGVDWIDPPRPGTSSDESAPTRPAESAAVPVVAPPAETPAIEARILVAEDGPDNQALFLHILTRAGAEVTIVEDGRQAVDAYFEAEEGGTPFDLVILDVQMPVLDGHGAARELRDRGATTPIIAVTAHALESDRDACLAAGCSDYETKPIDRRRLVSTIARHLSVRAADATR